MHTIKKPELFSDMDVIRKVLSGEIESFEILVRRYNPYLYKTGRSYGYNHQDTEDLMQEAFISAYLNLRTFENRSSFKAWVIRIMQNKCFQRRQKFSFKYEVSPNQGLPENGTPVFMDSHQTDTFKIVMKRELNHIVEEALQKIPADYRTVFSLRELNGLSVAETSEALSISENNVKVRFNRAKKILKAEVEKKYSPEDIFEFNLVYCDKIVNRVMEAIRRLEEAQSKIA